MARGHLANLVPMPSGPAHPGWNDGRMISVSGHVKLRIGKEHPLADPNGYAHEHLVIWCAAGNPRPPAGWLLHHINEVKTDNRIGNLELKRDDRHGIDHRSPLTDDDVVEMRKAYASTEATIVDLGEVYDVPFQTIWKIIRGRVRKAAGGPIQTGSLRGLKTRARAA